MAIAAFVIALLALAGVALLFARSGSRPAAADEALARRVDDLAERLDDLEAARAVEAIERAAARSR